MYMQTPSHASLPGGIIYTGCLCLREATHTLTTMQQIGCRTTAHLKRQCPCVPGSTSGGIMKELDKAVSHFHNLALRPLQKLPIACISKPSQFNSAAYKCSPCPNSTTSLTRYAAYLSGKLERWCNAWVIRKALLLLIWDTYHWILILNSNTFLHFLQTYLLIKIGLGIYHLTMS